MAGTLICGLFTAIALWVVGFVPNITFVLLVVLSACLGDVLLALSLDAINPTRVLVGPGDRKHHNSEVLDKAIVVEDFGADNEGYILVRGEKWRAICQQQSASMLQIGDHVKVIERAGLVLVVESAGNDT